MDKQIQKEIKTKSMPTFRSFREMNVIVFWMILQMVISGGIIYDKGYSVASILILMTAWIIMLYIIFVITDQWQLKYMQNRVNSSFDELIKEIYVAGFKIEKKLDDGWYVFVTGYIFLPKTRIIVKDCSSYCLIFGKESLLSNKAGIVEESNVENPVI